MADGATLWKTANKPMVTIWAGLQHPHIDTYEGNRRPTATRTPSLSMQRPQEAIGRAVSQSPEWGKHAAAILARSTGLLMEAKIDILSFSIEGLPKLSA